MGTLGEMDELMAVVKAGEVRPVAITPHRLREAGQASDELREGKTVERYVLTN